MSSIYGAAIAVVLALIAHSAGAETEPRLIGWLGETHSVASMGETSSPLSQSTLPDLPLVGFGTAALGPDTGKHVAEALDVGYRMLDSAQAREWYREDLVASAFRSSGIPREQIFITSKLHPRNHGKRAAREHFFDTLLAFNTSYVDLFLLHYPQCWESLCGPKPTEGTWEDSWAALEELVDEGVVRFIGVSNFNVEQFDRLIKNARRKPFLVQAYSDPLRQNRRLFEHVIASDVKFQAYSSLGSQWHKPVNPVLTHPTIVQLSNKYNVSTAQVVLQWAVQNGQYVVPRSTKPSHMKNNLLVAKQLWKLSMSDLQSINALDNSMF